MPGQAEVEISYDGRLLPAARLGTRERNGMCLKEVQCFWSCYSGAMVAPEEPISVQVKSQSACDGIHVIFSVQK